MNIELRASKYFAAPLKQGLVAWQVYVGCYMHKRMATWRVGPCFVARIGQRHGLAMWAFGFNGAQGIHQIYEDLAYIETEWD